MELLIEIRVLEDAAKARARLREPPYKSERDH
jgi:hypothetical protein